MSALLHRVEALSVDHSAAAARGDRAGIGQFFTPAVLAEFMASLLAPRTGEDVRILDPGAGTGILGIAAAERLLSTGAGSVHLVAVEHDADVLPRLRVALEATSAAYGQRFTYDVRVEDFLEYGQLIRPLEVFDVVIANPPYQKAPPDDPRGGGTPNLYTRFMEIAGALLDARGMLCFVIPRSYASGLYFRRFRQRFHRSVSMTRVHVFRSRRDAFKGDRVLQESIIVAAGKSPSETVTISSSEGLDDLSRATALTVPTRRVLDVTSPEAWLHLPETPGDLETLAAVESQPFRLSRLGLAISTGAVVPFRARDHLQPIEGSGYPLLWMQHVRRDAVRWPLPGLAKPQRLGREAPSSLLLEDSTYVLLRRFSAKDDTHRLVAAALPMGSLGNDRLAVENHVNVIRGATTGMDATLAVGLASVLNSDLYERYFRVLNGNTQVSATEIRSTPLPTREQLLRIGRKDVPPEDAIHGDIRVSA